MKSRGVVILGSAAWLFACSSDSASTELTEADAKSKATALVGQGAVDTSEKIDTPEEHRWKMEVRLSSGAIVFVEFDRADAKLVEMGGEQGPFEYDIAAPVAGYLTYGQAKAKALATKAGAVEAWEMEPGKTQYEFYVRDAETKLWEIKMNAQKGDITSTEEKAARD